MPSVRQQKVAAQIRRIVSESLLREVGDPRVADLQGMITVTRVDVTPDLADAKVYVSILTTKGTPKTVLSGLKSATRRIQGDVAKGLPIRVAPRLSFELDESLKKEAEILRTIDQVTREREANQKDQGDPAADNHSGNPET